MESQNPLIRLLYVQPVIHQLKFIFNSHHPSQERLGTDRFKDFLNRYKDKISFFAMDEAHVIDSWSEFRTGLNHIGKIRDIVPRAKWVRITSINVFKPNYQCPLGGPDCNGYK